MSSKTEQPVFDQVAEMFRQAGGTEDDQEWADAAATELLWKQAKEPYIQAVMGMAAQALHESGEPARAAFGDAKAWAHEQIAWLKSEGLDAFDSTRGPLSLRTCVEHCLWGAAWFSFVLFANALLNLLPGRTQWDFNPLIATLPLMLAALCTLVYGIYAAVRPRRRFAAAVAIAVVVAVLGATLMAGFLIMLQDSGPEWPWLWIAALIPFYAVLAWAVGRVWPESSRTSDDVEQSLALSDPDPVEWTCRLQAALRSRDDLSDAAIDTAVGEAHAHLDDSGRGAAEEFGSPEGYANTVRADPRVRPRRKMLLYGSMIAIWLVLLISEASEHGLSPSWPLFTYAALVLLSIWYWTGAYRDWRRAVRGKASRGGAAPTG
ncbi:hypothetical protein [Galactobacter sp.]|uniref:hypothetical protein n=1 Tax=Galactobacter sp. TaxID=2676125 RepID=UPI0025C36DA7|nr:hypothetical protein [Galactobacter sp.]